MSVYMYLFIALVLGAIVISAADYIGGESGSESTVKANALSLRNEASQISGKIDIYKAINKSGPSNFSDIMSDKFYNASQSDFGWTFDSASGIAYKVLDNEKYCKAVNYELGYDGPAPSCSSIPSELSGRSYYCCTN